MRVVPASRPLAASAVLLCAGLAAGQCQVAKLLPQDSPTAHANFGLSVAMSGDRLIVGARSAVAAPGVPAGAAYVYRRQPGGAWALEAKLVSSDGAAGDQFGVSVALRGDVAVVGAWLTDDAGSGSGSAYVFRRSGTVWTQEAELLAADAAAGDRLGVSVAVDGDVVVAGAPYTVQVGFNTGAAYVFRHAAGAWAQETKLEAPTLRSGSFFGNAAAVEGDLVAVGALGDSGGGIERGTVNLYRGSAAAWSHEATLTALDGEDRDSLGSSVSISQGAVLAGAYQAAGPVSADQGAAYLFRKAAGIWGQEAKLVAAAGAGGDAFGWSVCLRGDEAAVGAYGVDLPGAEDAGAAYLFRRVSAGSLWAQAATLAPAGSASDAAGISVAVDGGFAAAGAYNHDALASNAGAAYVFSAAACACYANCDGSTVPPVLNVADFICFMNLFAGSDPQANCDGSTVPPVLNVNDFVCFQGKYAQGCP